MGREVGGGSCLGMPVRIKDFNGLLDSEGGRGWDDLGEWHSNMYTIM